MFVELHGLATAGLVQSELCRPSILKVKTRNRYALLSGFKKQRSGLHRDRRQSVIV